LEPLFRESEDPLEHSSGIGLWAIKWGVEQLDGAIEFTENDPRGSIIQLYLPDMD
jgi:sensor histidine kinase regulating citrate/malate metabolism